MDFWDSLLTRLKSVAASEERKAQIALETKIKKHIFPFLKLASTDEEFHHSIILAEDSLKKLAGKIAEEYGVDSSSLFEFGKKIILGQRRESTKVIDSFTVSTDYGDFQVSLEKGYELGAKEYSGEETVFFVTVVGENGFYAAIPYLSEDGEVPEEAQMVFDSMRDRNLSNWPSSVKQKVESFHKRIRKESQKSNSKESQKETLNKKRAGLNPHCPHCGSIQLSRKGKNNYSCNICGKGFKYFPDGTYEYTPNLETKDTTMSAGFGSAHSNRRRTTKLARYYHSTDVVGYTTADGDVLCPDCAEYATTELREKGIEPLNEYGELDAGYFYPIFADSEWDYQPYCSSCGKEIEGVTVLGDDTKSSFRGMKRRAQNIFTPVNFAESPDNYGEERGTKTKSEKSEVTKSYVTEDEIRRWFGGHIPRKDSVVIDAAGNKWKYNGPSGPDTHEIELIDEEGPTPDKILGQPSGLTPKKKIEEPTEEEQLRLEEATPEEAKEIITNIRRRMKKKAQVIACKNCANFDPHSNLCLYWDMEVSPNSKCEYFELADIDFPEKRIKVRKTKNEEKYAQLLACKNCDNFNPEMSFCELFEENVPPTFKCSEFEPIDIERDIPTRYIPAPKWEEDLAAEGSGRRIKKEADPYVFTMKFPGQRFYPDVKSRWMEIQSPVECANCGRVIGRGERAYYDALKKEFICERCKRKMLLSRRIKRMRKRGQVNKSVLHIIELFNSSPRLVEEFVDNLTQDEFAKLIDEVNILPGHERLKRFLDALWDERYGLNKEDFNDIEGQKNFYETDVNMAYNSPKGKQDMELKSKRIKLEKIGCVDNDEKIVEDIFELFGDVIDIEKIIRMDDEVEILYR